MQVIRVRTNHHYAFAVFYSCSVQEIRLIYFKFNVSRRSKCQAECTKLLVICLAPQRQCQLFGLIQGCPTVLFGGPHEQFLGSTP